MRAVRIEGTEDGKTTLLDLDTGIVYDFKPAHSLLSLAGPGTPIEDTSGDQRYYFSSTARKLNEQLREMLEYEVRATKYQHERAMHRTTEL